MRSELRSRLRKKERSARPRGWREKLLEATLFRLSHRIDSAVRAKTSLEDFRRVLSSALKVEYADGLLLSDKTFRGLYEKAVWAKVEMEQTLALQRIVKSTAWRTHKKWTKHTISLAATLEGQLKGGNRKYLPAKILLARKPVRSKIQALRYELLGTQRYDKKLDHFAKWRLWNEVYRKARLRMFLILEKNQPVLTAGQQIEVVRLVCERMKLKDEVTTDAVKQFRSRTLS